MYKKIVNIIGTFLITFGVITVIILLLASSSFFNLVRIRYVSTGSMAPKIKVASLVLIVKTNPATLKKGDVITFMPSETGIPITHRIFDITNKDNQLIFTTKGDANNIPDINPVLSKDILGKVV